MISNNYIPEKINDANIYLAGDKMIGTTAELELPEVKMKDRKSTTSELQSQR